jgi:hypothetical protein
LTTFPAERAVLRKERAAGAYRLSAYFLAKTTSEIPLELLYPTMFMFITYWMAGMEADAGKFFSSWWLILLTTLAAQSLGLAISCAIMDFKKSIVFASVLMLSLMLLGGLCFVFAFFISCVDFSRNKIIIYYFFIYLFILFYLFIYLFRFLRFESKIPRLVARITVHSVCKVCLQHLCNYSVQGHYI